MAPSLLGLHGSWFFFNARSICNKLLELQLFISVHNPVVLGLCETHADPDMPDSLFCCSGYKIFRKDRNRFGGGVALLVHQDLFATEVKLSDQYSSVELICVDITMYSIKYRTIMYYRRPYFLQEDVDYFELSMKCLTELVQKSPKPVILMGDFNLPDVDWNLYSAPANAIYDMFIKFINEFGLSQLVCTPTRLSDTCKNSILDLLITNTHNVISEINVQIPFSTSDHCVIQFSINNPAANNSPWIHSDDDEELYYDFKNADYEMIERFLATVNWTYEFSFVFSLEEYWNVFVQFMYRAMQLYVPVRKHSYSSKPGVKKYPKYLKRMFTRKLKLWQKWISSRDVLDKRKYENYAVKCKNAIRMYNAEYESTLVNCNNLGQFYRYVNAKLSHSKNLPHLKSTDGRLITSSIEKANIFNQYFASVFTVDNGNAPVRNFKLEQNCALADVEFSPIKVYRALRSLKPKTSHGPDGLPNILLHNLAGVVCGPLSFIFNASFQSGSLPQCWLDALVTPVFKKGETSSPSNYRPISLTCVCCRVMERIINIDIIDYLHKNKIINAAQHGFLHKRSTYTNLLESVCDWSDALNRKHSVDVIYIDFQKAFDTVSHPKLILKLESYGITGHLLDWLRAFLTNRTQAVKVLSCISEKINVTSGVPQGSVLGPTLFLIYINDLHDIVSDLNITVKLFADDAKIYSVLDAGLSDDLCTACSRITQWAENWQMRLALNKCNVLRITNKTRHETTTAERYMLGGEYLSWCTEARDLGILVDNKLLFNQHISSMVHKAHVRARLILRCFSSRDCSVLLKAFNAYVRPLLEYCSSVWSPCTVTNINKIEAVQRSFTKNVTELTRCCYEERLLNLCLESLELRRLKNDLINLYKLMHGCFDICCTSFFEPFVDSYTRGHAYKLHKQFCSVNAFKNSFPHRCIDAWNSLPVNVVEAKTISQFKRELNNIDLTRYCNSVL